MKNFLILFFLIGLLAVGCSSPPDNAKPASVQTEFVQAADLQVHADVIYAVDETALPAPDTPAAGPIDWLKKNAAELLLAFFAFLKVVVNLTPTEKDNKIFELLDKLISWIVPNYRAGGGKFT